MLPCFVLLLVLREVFFLFLAECPLNEFLLPLLLITFDRLPLLRRDSELFRRAADVILRAENPTGLV